MVFALTPNVEVTRDAEGIVRLLLHYQQPYTPQAAGIVSTIPHLLAAAYVRDVASIYGIEQAMLTTLSEKVGDQLRDESNQLRLGEEKTVLDTVVIGYVQNHLGLPIWQAGFSVRINKERFSVTSSQSSLHLGAKVKRPKRDAVFTPERSAIENLLKKLARQVRGKLIRITKSRLLISVSYTHLTLPTILRV